MSRRPRNASGLARAAAVQVLAANKLLAIRCQNAAERGRFQPLFPKGPLLMARLRVYLSSTFDDLKDYRAATFSALEKAGLDVARMEAYTATDIRPLDLCLRDVAASDILIGVYAWRYGYEPPAHHSNPKGQSITELEYRQAERLKIRRLVFLAHPDTKALWPAHFVDESTGAGAGGARVGAFRAEVGSELTAGMFRSPNELAVLVLASLMRTGLTHRPYNIPPQRAGVVPRPGLTDAVSNALVGDASAAGRNTLVFGGGGFGKTTLALSTCHLPAVVKAFPDGLLWVVLGEHADLATVLSDLHLAVAGERPAASSAASIVEQLALLLDKRRCLLVIDDVWRSDHLEHFLGLPNTRLLVTTRIQNLLAVAGWAEIPIDQMQEEESAAVLGRGLPVDAASRPALIDLAQKLGCWPLLLALANARLLEEQKSRQDVVQAIAMVSAVYARKGVLGFDRRDSKARNTAVARSVEVGLEHAESMYPGLAARASEMAIFPEDVAVPVRVLADLWGLDEFYTKEDVVRPLDNVCLLEWDRERDEVSVHDIIRRVLETRLADAAGSHGRLVDAWAKPLQLPHDYAWRRLAYHLAHGRREAQLRALLCDFAWLRAKLEATDITALVADFETFGTDDPLWLVQGALLLASAYLAADKAQLASQLIGRLLPGTQAEIDQLLARANAWRGETWLRPLQPTLHAPGGSLIRVFRGYAGGHRGTVRSIAMDSAGHRAVSAGNSHPDQSLIVWNLATGTHYKLEGQAEAGGWTPLSMNGQGDIFVSAHAGEVRAWRLGEPAPFARCQVPGTQPAMVAIADNGTRVVIGEAGGEIAVWNPSTSVTSALGRHGQTVVDIAVTPDGTRAVSSNGLDLRLWDLESGCELQRWSATDFSRGSWSRGISIAADGRRVAWSGVAPGGDKGALWTWDATTGIPTLGVEVPEGGLFAFNSEHGRAIMGRSPPNGLNDASLALFVFGEQPRIIDMTDIGRGISCAAISRDGRWATTADYEHDVMFWDLDRALRAPAGAVAALPPWHALPFRSFTEDGRYALFGAPGSALLVWDIDAAAPAPVAALTESLVNPVSRVDPTEAARGPRQVKFATKGYVGGEPDERGHTAPILDREMAPNRRWEATASEDGTLRIWDLAAHRLLATFSDATIFRRCAWAADSRTLAVVDYRSKTHLLRLDGNKP